MPVLHQWDYLFAFGTIFAALDAFNIGANDVANSFATSVSSRSLTMKQAVLAAAICEFLGALLVGARVADTIKNGIVSLSIFQGNPGVQLLAFTCALIASATWLMIATRYSWPVSTTYSIVSAVAGVGVAIGGPRAVNWGWNGGKGLATIFAGFLIAPALAGTFAALTFLIVKYGALERKNALKCAFMLSPFLFFGITAVLTLSIIYKGAPSLGLADITEETQAAAIVGTSAVITALAMGFWLPFVYCKVVRKDYTIRWFHFFYGPALWWRTAPEDAGQDGTKIAVQDYRIRDRDTAEDGSAPSHSDAAPVAGSASSVDDKDEKEIPDLEAPSPSQPAALKSVEVADLHPIDGAWAEPANLWIIVRYRALPWIKTVLTHGTSIDIHALQNGPAGSKEAVRMQTVYANARQYPNEVEHLFSFLQVLTACTSSFAHGANDVANAIGPYSVIYQVWSTGAPSPAKATVPLWILAFGGIFIVIGLATYGYNIIKVLGNKITLVSPSRGTSMELGASITVIIASIYGIPVSTTMSITGATLGVALCNGTLSATNWRALAWILLGWILTVPVVGTAAGCLMSIILYAPRF